MIIVRISGGLGNQMFQYALICALKKKYLNTEIKADISDYKKVHAHTGYSLHRYFSIDIPIATKKEVDQISYIPCDFMRPELKTGIQGIFYKLGYKFYHKQREYLKPFNISDYVFNIYNPEVFQLNPDRHWYLNGYWQNMMYFTSIDQDFHSIFKFTRNFSNVDAGIIEEMKRQNSVSVHVRRGDYVSSDFDICNKSYYLNAKRIIEDRIESPVYYFFSDEPEYVEREFKDFTNKIVISHKTEDCDIDMYMMAQCKHSINANSSFSFWGSVLKQHSGIIISPKYTMVKQYKKYESVHLDDWIIIDNLKKY